MKKLHLLFTLLIVGFTAFAQNADPVKWNFTARKKTASTYEVVLSATLPKPWHIYSQNTEGSLPTTISFNTNPLVSLDGKAKETGSLIKMFDKNLKENVAYYSNKVSFTQTVKVKAGIKTNITGFVKYMVCDDEKCLAPTKKSFDIKLQ